MSLVGIVADCHHLMKLRASSRGITIHEVFEQAMPRLWADERAIRQVVLNLLSNSIKFTPQGGEIWLKADSTMQGYLDNEAATREVLRDGWYRSGDLARRDADGFLFVVDRSKDMIITGGENVYSKEVEDVLVAHPDIQDAAVIGRPHAQWGETVVAVLVSKPGTQPDPEAIKAFAAERLARYKVPREFVMRDALPRTPTGKLMKHVLRADVV